MRPRLVLHAGTHKTGTTAIQAFCAANRQGLLARGYLYPTLPVKGPRASQQHHDLAHAIARQSRRLTTEQAVSLIEEWAELALRSGVTMLLSAEPIWRHTLPVVPGPEGRKPRAETWLAGRDAYLADLASALRPFDTHVILVFRNPADFAQSMYVERISSSLDGVNAEFSEFATGLLKDALRYGENCRLFRKHFESIQCLVYEDLCETDLLDAFFDAAGIAVDGLGSGAVVRKSMKPAEARITNFIKHMTPKDARKRAVAELLAEPALREMIDGYVRRNRGAEFWAGADERSHLLTAAEPQLRILAEEFGVDTSRWRGGLADRSAPTKLTEIDPDTEHAVAQFVQAWWETREEANRELRTNIRSE